MIKNIAINLGSTSTKIAYYEDGECKFKENIQHDPSLIVNSSSIWDQYAFRKEAIDRFISDHGIDLNTLDAFSSRGGHCEPVIGGTYRINEALLAQNRSGKYGMHIGNVGLQIAYDYAKAGTKTIPMTTDLPVTDELEPLARYSGLAGMERESRFQALNHKAMARYYAESTGRKYEDVNLVVVMLGGGISVAAHKQGKIIDAPDGLTGEGPFSNNRTGTLPLGKVIRLCFSGQYTEKEMLKLINGKGGLVSYVGTTDIREIERLAKEGSEAHRMALEAMCYQTAKEIGAMSTVLKGRIDAILFTGGMANSTFITDLIKERVEFIAPVVIIPGEREMESLCMSAYRVLTGQEKLLEFVPSQEV